jgi:hypothetical protein
MDRRPYASRTRGRRGQVMALFALLSIFIFAVAGLAIDAGISYLSSNNAERAAASAALAGAAYLPGNYAAAQNAALVEASRNGYADAGSGNTCTGNPSPCVSTSQPASNQLEVTISVSVSTTFLRLLGFGNHTVTRSAVAEYLPPIQMGEPGNELGTTMGTAAGDLGNGSEYLLRTEGWGNPRHEGDAFTPSPDDNESDCGPNIGGPGNVASCVANPPDVHQVSCIAGDDLCANDANGATDTNCGQANQLCLNDVGGSNFLIYVPAGTTTNFQVYNPSFDPGNDTDCGSQTPVSCLNTLHDNDGSFPALNGISAADTPVASDFDSMGFTLFAVPVLDNRAADVPLVEDIFCPFNAYDLDTGTAADYSYYEEGTSSSGCNPVHSNTATYPATLEQEAGVPTTFNSPPGDTNAATEQGPQWVSLISPNLTGQNANLYVQNFVGGSEGTYTSGGQLSGGASGQYFRLRVDTLAWNGAVISTTDSINTPATDSGALPDNYPLGHNAYSLEATSCASCTISGLADMTIYTPIDGATATGFGLPLFNVPSAYAGKVITVSVFNPGVGGGGNAYLGLLQPSYTSGATTYPEQFATLAPGCDGNTTVDYLGTSLNAGTCSGVTMTAAATNQCAASPSGYACNTSNAAFMQTGTTSTDAYGQNYSGDAIYRGSWLRFQIEVPSTYNPGASGAYWDLYYGVSSSAYAGNTITFEAQYLGSPVHLLPGG